MMWNDVAVLGSVAAGVWRLFIFPLDTLKTSLQVGAPDHMRARREGFSVVPAIQCSIAVSALPRTHNWLLPWPPISTSVLVLVTVFV